MLKRVALFLLKAGFAAGILTWLIMRNGVTILDITAVPLIYPVMAGVCMLCQILLTGIRWWSLLRYAGLKVPFAEAISLCMQGAFYTLFIPGGSVGGDLIKAGILAKRAPAGQKFIGVFTILMDRLCGLTALVIATLFSCVWCLPAFHEFSRQQQYFLYTIAAVCAGVLLACIMIFFHDYFYRFGWIKRCLELLDKFSKGSFTKAAEATAMYRVYWKQLCGWIFATVLIFFPFLAQSLWFLVRGTTETVPDWSRIFLTSNISNTIAAIPLTNGGIGTRDVVTKMLLQGSGLPETEAAAIPLLYTGVFLLVSFLGAFFVVFDSFFRNKICNPQDVEYNKE